MKKLIVSLIVLFGGVMTNLNGYGYFFWNNTGEPIQVKISKRACKDGCPQWSNIIESGHGYRFDTGTLCLDSYEISSGVVNYSIQGGANELGGSTGFGMRCADGELTVLPAPGPLKARGHRFTTQTGKHL